MSFLKLLGLGKKKPRTDLALQMVEGQLMDRRAGTNPFEQFQVRSLVAAGVTINGDVISDKGAAVDGTINGNITIVAANAALLVRVSGVVAGNLSAPMVMLRGTVTGDVTARFVRLYAGSRVAGQIRAERLVVDDGAEIQTSDLGSGVSVAGAALASLPGQASAAADAGAQADQAPAAVVPALHARHASADDFIAVFNVAPSSPPALRAVANR